MIVLPTLATALVLAASASSETAFFSPNLQGASLSSGGELGRTEQVDSSYAASAQKAKKADSKRAMKKAQLVPASRGRGGPSLSDPETDGPQAQTVQVAFEAPIAPRPGQCPAGMVMIGRGYCVDIYEGALLEVLSDGAERPFSPYLMIPKGTKVRAINGKGLVPQGYISGLQAREACQNSGKRLCKPEEWRTACMGPKKTIFPYGNERTAMKCNDHGRSSMHFFNNKLTDKPEDAWRWGHNGNMLDPRLNQLEGTLARSGEHPDCTNEYGVYDMVGNIHEWVDDPAGTFQGGYYLDTHWNGDGCYYATVAHPMSHIDYSTGFRCCADVPE